MRLHSFLGRCGPDTLDSIFPSSEKRRITFDEMKEITVFEETEGHEETITYWHNYLLQLSKYEPGINNTALDDLVPYCLLFIFTFVFNDCESNQSVPSKRNSEFFWMKYIKYTLFFPFV